MSRTRRDAKSEVIREGSTASCRLLSVSGRPDSAWPESLNGVDEGQLGQMSAGDVIVLDHSPGLRRHVASTFYAIVACPACSVPGLITPQQYSGVTPVICPSDHCSCHFRIREGGELVYLPVN
jgi:hypothetical protein